MAHLGGTQAGVEPLIFELRIRLALPVDDGSDIHQQVGQVVFCQFAAADTKCIQTRDAAVDFVHPFANRLAVPAEFTFDSAGATRTERFDGARHKVTEGTYFVLRCRVEEQAFQLVRHLHTFPPNLYGFVDNLLTAAFLSFYVPYDTSPA